MISEMPSPEVWELRKPRILTLYSSGLQLKMVMKTLSTEGFHATETQYRTKLKKWKYRKPRKCRKQSKDAKAPGEPSPVQNQRGADPMECDLAFLAPHRITPESKFNDACFSSVADEAFPIDQQPSVPPILRHFEADKRRLPPAIAYGCDTAMIMQPSPYTTWDAPPHASSFMASSRFDNSSFPTTPEIDAVTPHSGFTQEETSEYSRRTRHHASQGNGYQARVEKAVRRAIGAEERKQSSHCKETALSTTTPPVTVASPVTVHPPMMVQSPMMAPPATIVHPPMIIDPRLMIDPLMMVDPPTMVDPAAVDPNMFLHQVSATHPDCPFDAAFPAQHPQVPESWWQ